MSALGGEAHVVNHSSGLTMLLAVLPTINLGLAWLEDYARYDSGMRQ